MIVPSSVVGFRRPEAGFSHPAVWAECIIIKIPTSRLPAHPVVQFFVFLRTFRHAERSITFFVIKYTASRQHFVYNMTIPKTDSPFVITSTYIQ